MALGFHLADAVHLSAARQLGIDVFVTTDDKLRKLAKRHGGRLGVRVVDPVTFVQEMQDVHHR